MAALLIAIPMFYRRTMSPDQWWVKPLNWGVLLLRLLVVQGWWLFSGNPTAWPLTVEAFFYALHLLLCALIIAAAATADLDGRRGINTWRPFVALGEWSFAFYLIHARLIYVAIEVFGPKYDSSLRTLPWCVLLTGASARSKQIVSERLRGPLPRMYPVDECRSESGDPFTFIYVGR